jgi:hypothetical protein
MQIGDWVFDNHSIAILTRVNDLAERWAIKPYEFYANVDYGDLKNALTMYLEYSIYPHDPDKKDRFFKMLKSLGLSTEKSTLQGTSAEIIEALDNALRLSPRTRF